MRDLVLGPILFWELVRQARKSRLFTLRVAYLSLLLVVLVLMDLGWFGGKEPILETLAGRGRSTPIKVAFLAERLSIVFLGLQLGAILLLTPAFTAGAIAEERERNTLDFLLLTHQSASALILGKLLARLSTLFLLLIGGLPILALLWFLGGVDPHLILGGFAITALTMLGLASVGILQSALVSSTHAAIFRTYLLALGYLATTSLCLPAVETLKGTSAPFPERLLLWPVAGNPALLLLRLANGLGSGIAPAKVLVPVLLDCALFQGVLSAYCLWKASAALRRGTDPNMTLPPVASVPLERPPTREPATYAADDSDTENEPSPTFSRPPIDERPMLWKERFAEPLWRVAPETGRLLVLVTFLFLIAATLGLCMGLAALVTANVPTPEVNRRLSWALVPLALLGCLIVAIRAAGTITGERQRRTLESLLATDLTNGEIVTGKWLGSLLAPFLLWYVLLAWVFLAALTGIIGLVAFLLTPLFIAVHGALAASAGLACSLSAASSWRATVWALLLLGLLWVGHWGIYLSCTTFTDLWRWREAELAELHAFLTPPVALAYAISGAEALLVLRGLAIHALLAVLLFGYVRARFARATGRMPVR
jgi:ABC-type transport system involved in multi-copper enzyme maturation permease subunit